MNEPSPLNSAPASPAVPETSASGMSPGAALAGIGAAIVSFQAAFLIPLLSPLVIVSLGCLFGLRRLGTPRRAFYAGLGVGLGVFVPQMGFLWEIFQAAAIPLWVILALFHAVFLLTLNRVEVRWGSGMALVLAPVLWCGIEYFRSEVWWLKFSWFSAGTCLTPSARGLLMLLGVYGCGALAMTLGALGCRMVESASFRQSPKARILLGAGVVGTAGLVAMGWMGQGSPETVPGTSRMTVAGAQLEAPGVPEVRQALDRLRTKHPGADLLMLSEYTFDGPVPEVVRAWCRRHRKWLVAGGKDPVPDEDRPAGNVLNRWFGSKALPGVSPGGEAPFFNTAFVIGPEGEVAFRQVKSRPIQFFKDGEPARTQNVWESPWGRLGIAICYDASYRRVMDGLVRQGVQALLIPTMDLETWGAHQHALNARMARLRAVEAGVPVFRVASSGISQVLDARGRERATAPFPGSGEMIFGELVLGPVTRRLPWDAWFAPACTWATGGVLLALTVAALRARGRPRAKSQPVPGPGNPL